MRQTTSMLVVILALVAGSAAAEPQSTSPPPHLAMPPAAQKLDAGEMAEASGGQGVTVEVLTRQQLVGTTTGNTVNAGTLTSGAVAFDANALDGFSGVGNFVINTGANNTLQGAINLSIVTTPAP
jgi:hypothetical protein